MKTDFESYARSGEYNYISNSYIIFELTTGFRKEVNDLGVFMFPDILEYLFSNWKQHGCAIMFICGSNESRFGNHKGFLNYVDLHLNISSFDTFMFDIIDILTINGANHCLDECTIILDNKLSENITQGDYKNAWFFYNWLIPLVREAYRTEILSGMSSRDIYDARNIRILCHMGGNSFYDVRSCTEITYDEAEPTDFTSNYLTDDILAIGTDWSSDTSTQDWLDILFSLRSQLNYNFPVFLCNTNGFDTSAYNSQTFFYTTGPIIDYYDIIVDFLNDNISQYNNVSGYCYYTYLALHGGANGWMEYQPLSDEEILPWILFIDDPDGFNDENNYYYSYADNW